MQSDCDRGRERRGPEEGRIELPSELVQSLQTAYSAERAAAYAYIGHRQSLADETEKERIHEIEQDEWSHRTEVGRILDQYGRKPLLWLEIKFLIIGRAIGLSCLVIGRFMPYFFAGKLESGNVCEYLVMRRRFNEVGIHEHDEILHEMGMKEKDHEIYFLQILEGEPWLPWFERLFGWGQRSSLNDVPETNREPTESATNYCRRGQSRPLR